MPKNEIEYLEPDNSAEELAQELSEKIREQEEILLEMIGFEQGDD